MVVGIFLLSPEIKNINFKLVGKIIEIVWKSLKIAYFQDNRKYNF